MHHAKKILLAAIFALNGAVIVSPASAAAYELEAARDPDGKVVVYCEWCMFFGCDC
jgi:hypothetical protein